MAIKYGWRLPVAKFRDQNNCHSAQVLLSYFCLTGSYHVRQTETDHHRLDQRPGDTAQGDPGTAALACGDGIGGGGYPRGRIAEGETSLCAHPTERRIRLPAT